ncbi:hypothetical protein B0H63DRAFT_242870 [Podospora didyma]|uniref:MICOS complex subunit MIC12 n=1 Tax=Podospora didyma TaxID=330526 RepID=A0AAE0KLB0_9PEZI|nr:hypothetical protein B0H63DRAFT_242870 [Podospora didyma]
MGFVAGFTGGVTLTLGVTYLALAAHERNRQTQADILRTQARVVHTLATPTSTYASSDDDALILRPSRRELAMQERSHFIESAKDRWNAEIEGAVRWAQTKDWTATFESAEDAAARLVGLTPAQRESMNGAAAQAAVVSAVGQAKEDLQAAARGAQATASSAAEGIRSRYGRTKVSVAETAHDLREDVRLAGEEINRRAGETRVQAVETARAVQQEAVAAKGALAQGIEKGIEKGRQMIGKAKARALLAEEKIEAKVDGKLLHLSEIDRALAQRYEKDEGVMKKSVEEILRERYIPISKRDNTQLRGV